MNFFIWWAVIAIITLLMIYIRAHINNHKGLKLFWVAVLSIFFPIPWAVLIASLFVNLLGYRLILEPK